MPRRKLDNLVSIGKLKTESPAAIQLHIEGLKEDGIPIPSSTAIAEYVVVGG